MVEIEMVAVYRSKDCCRNWYELGMHRREQSRSFLLASRLAALGLVETKRPTAAAMPLATRMRS